MCKTWFFNLDVHPICASAVLLADYEGIVLYAEGKGELAKLEELLTVLPRYIAKGNISRLNVYIAKGDISRLNVYIAKGDISRLNVYIAKD